MMGEILFMDSKKNKFQNWTHKLFLKKVFVAFTIISLLGSNMAFAVTGDQIAKDGRYTATGYGKKSDRGISLTVVVKDGKIIAIENIIQLKEGKIRTLESKYRNQAYQIINRDYIGETASLNNVDAVSQPTKEKYVLAMVNAIKKAIKDAPAAPQGDNGQINPGAGQGDNGQNDQLIRMPFLLEVLEFDYSTEITFLIKNGRIIGLEQTNNASEKKSRERHEKAREEIFGHIQGKTPAEAAALKIDAVSKATYSTKTFKEAISKLANEYKAPEKPTITRTVTFKIENGSWSDGTTADKKVTLTGKEGDALTLAASQIPAIGNPNAGYKVGSWDVEPQAGAVTQDVTYTYKFVEKETISKTVTFKIENGSWSDGTTVDKKVELTGKEGDTLTLAADQIPAIGNPNAGYKVGNWDAEPQAGAVTEDVTYTYKFVEKEQEPGTDEPTDPNDDEQATTHSFTLNVQPDEDAEFKEYSTTITFKVKDRKVVGLEQTSTATSGYSKRLHQRATAKILEQIQGKSIDEIASIEIDAASGATRSTETFKSAIKKLAEKLKVEEKKDIERTVTFKIENGSWSDGSTEDKIVELKGKEGETLTLAADQIPEIGEPNDGYKVGSWNVEPIAGEVTEDVEYVYSFVKEDTQPGGELAPGDNTGGGGTGGTTPGEGSGQQNPGDDTTGGTGGGTPGDNNSNGGENQGGDNQSGNGSQNPDSNTGGSETGNQGDNQGGDGQGSDSGQQNSNQENGQQNQGSDNNSSGQPAQPQQPQQPQSGNSGASSSGGTSYFGGASRSSVRPDPVSKKREEVIQDRPTPLASAEQTKFDDVTESHWAYGAVMESVEKGFFVGISKTIFALSKTLTRAEFITVLSRILKAEFKSNAKNVFVDVKDDDYYAKAANWALEKGYISVVDNKFEPNANMTREDVAIVLAKVLQEKGSITLEKTSYKDEQNISEQAKQSIQLVSSSKVMSGHANGIFGAKESLTRAQLASIILRLSEALAK